MNELNHYGKKGMKWGKRHVDPAAQKNRILYGNLGGKINTSLAGLYGTNADFQKLMGANSVTKQLGYSQSQLADYAKTIQKFAYSSNGSGSSPLSGSSSSNNIASSGESNDMEKSNDKKEPSTKKKTSKKKQNDQSETFEDSGSTPSKLKKHLKKRVRERKWKSKM